MNPYQTAESVTCGHPDKVADQISDAILDAYISADPSARVAVETMVTGDALILAGETRSAAPLSPQQREAIGLRVLADLGYPAGEDDLVIYDRIAEQSPQIALAVDGETLGAGDQGIMYGYATRETAERLPLPQVVARDLTDLLTGSRSSGEMPWLRADGKSQVTIDGAGDTAAAVVVSTLHDESIALEEVRELLSPLVRAVLEARGLRLGGPLLINPAGTWTHGGPAADTGLTGRKLMVDSYGGLVPHGGGAFSGKDPSKVDRSAAYAARQAAKWVVDEGLARTALVKLAYAIGVADPVMVAVETTGPTRFAWRLEHLIRDRFDFRPAAIIDRLGLAAPIYEETARAGHFGRPTYSWEATVG